MQDFLQVVWVNQREGISLASLIDSQIKAFQAACRARATQIAEQDGAEPNHSGAFYSDTDAIFTRLDQGMQTVTFYTHLEKKKGEADKRQIAAQIPLEHIFAEPQDMAGVIDKLLSGLYIHNRDFQMLQQIVPVYNARAMLPISWEMHPQRWLATFTDGLNTYTITHAQGEYVLLDSTDRAMARGHYLRSVVDSMYHKFSLRFAAQMAEAEAFIEKLNTSLASHLVDTEVVEKLNAGLKSYHERDAGEKHA